MAAELIRKADKEKNRWFVSEEQKASNAADYLEQAGNLYKSQKQHGDAAQCFIRSATLKVKIGRGYDAAKLFETAGIQLRLGGDPTATQVLNQAVDIYSELGKGQMAAKLSKQLGEGSEKVREYEDALIHFQRAAELFKGEGSDTHARQCLEKVATFHAMTDPPNYSDAARLFEEVGVESLSSRLGRFNARKYFFRAVLCVMASGDTIGARAKHSEFKETDYQFGGSREGKFLDLLITALEAFSGEKFSEAYRDYVEISPLDPWHTAVLREAQKVITGDEEVAPKTTAAPAAKREGGAKSMPIGEFLGGGGGASGASGASGGGGGAAEAGAEAVPAIPEPVASDDEDNDIFG